MPIGAGQARYAKFTPTPLNFGTVTVGGSVSLSVTFKNLGPTTLPINNATLTGVNHADFANKNSNPPCGGSVPAGGTCTMTFSFTPSFAGSEQATFNVYVYSGATPQKLKLSGIGGS
jgi:hypothetical protein